MSWIINSSMFLLSLCYNYADQETILVADSAKIIFAVFRLLQQNKLASQQALHIV